MGKQYVPEMTTTYDEQPVLEASHYGTDQGNEAEGALFESVVSVSVHPVRINWNEKPVMTVILKLEKFGKNRKAISLTNSIALDDLKKIIAVSEAYWNKKAQDDTLLGQTTREALK